MIGYQGVLMSCFLPTTYLLYCEIRIVSVILCMFHFTVILSEIGNVQFYTLRSMLQEILAWKSA
jgi:hypothetical protein